MVDRLPAECRTPVVLGSCDRMRPLRRTEIGETRRPTHEAAEPRPSPQVTLEPRAQAISERVAQTIAARHYSRRTERAYAGWVRRYIAFHRGRGVAEMGEAEITQFLSTLVTRDQVTASTQNQADVLPNGLCGSFPPVGGQS